VGSDERYNYAESVEYSKEGVVTYFYTTTLTARSYVRADANWNVTSLVRAVASASPVFGTVERYEYDPYGSVTYLSGSFGALDRSGFGQSYLHQGGRLDEVTGLYSFRFREYDPGQGRWKQADPAGYVDGGSLYQALLSSPIRFTDPSGLSSRAAQANAQVEACIVDALEKLKKGWIDARNVFDDAVRQYIYDQATANASEIEAQMYQTAIIGIVGLGASAIASTVTAIGAAGANAAVISASDGLAAADAAANSGRGSISAIDAAAQALANANRTANLAGSYFGIGSTVAGMTAGAAAGVLTGGSMGDAAVGGLQGVTSTLTSMLLDSAQVLASGAIAHWQTQGYLIPPIYSANYLSKVKLLTEEFLTAVDECQKEVKCG